MGTEGETDNMIGRAIRALDLVPHSSQAEDRVIHSRQVSMLYGQGVFAQIGVLINIAILTLLALGHGADLTLVAWVCASVLLTCLRLMLGHAYEHVGYQHPDASAWASLYVIGTFASGVCWGILGIHDFGLQHSAHLEFVTFVLAGISAGAIVLYPSVLCVGYAFILPALLPVAIRLLCVGDGYSFAMGVLALTFIGVMGRSLFVTNSKLKRMLRLKGVNRDLLEDVQQSTKQLEARNIQLAEALQAAENAGAVKGAFLANVSHELKTPMNAILGMSDLVLDTSLTEEQRGYLELVRSSAHSLLGTINNLFDYSMIESGTLELRVAPFDPRELLTEVEMALRPLAKDAGVMLFQAHDVIDAQMLLGDVDRITQSLIHLGDNALKFTDPGGVVILYVAVNADGRNGRSLECAVIDTGIGIPRDKHKQIFQSFTQLEEHTTRSYGGTGIGLSICDQLVRLMGGTLQVHSKLGLGSRFSFSLELEGVHDQPAQLSERSAQVVVNASCGTQECGTNGHVEPDQMSVLFVDDNPINRTLGRTLLESCGCNVVLANSGEEGIEASLASNFDLILLDSDLPDLDSNEVVTRIRQIGDEQVRSVPIVGMCSENGRQQPSELVELGIEGCLEKPLQRHAIESLLQRVLHLGG